MVCAAEELQRGKPRADKRVSSAAGHEHEPVQPGLAISESILVVLISGA